MLGAITEAGIHALPFRLLDPHFHGDTSKKKYFFLL